MVCIVCCNKYWQKSIWFLFYHLYKCKKLSCCVLLIKRNVMHFRQINNQKILWFMIKSRLTAFSDWAAFHVIVWTNWCSSEDNRGTYLLLHNFDRNCDLGNHLSSLTISCRLLHSPLCCKTLDKYWRYQCNNLIK